MVVYTVSYSFSNVGGGFNATNHLSGTTYINNVVASQMIINVNLNLGTRLIIPSSGQLGYRISGTFPTLLTNSNVRTILSSITLPAGTWIINAMSSFQSSSAVLNTIQTYMFAISTTLLFNTAGCFQEIFYNGGNTICATGFGNLNLGQFLSKTMCQVVQITTLTTYNFLLQMEYVGSLHIFSNMGSYFYATRIA